MTKVEFNADRDPYTVVVPYSTCDEAASFVIQVITTPVDEMPLDVIPEISGAVVSVAADVVKVLSPDTA